MAATSTCCCRTSRFMPPGRIPDPTNASPRRGSPSVRNRVMPHAPDVAGTSAKVVILRQSGVTETYDHSLDCDRHAARRGAGAVAENSPGPADDRAPAVCAGGAGLHDRTVERPVVGCHESRRTRTQRIRKPRSGLRRARSATPASRAASAETRPISSIRAPSRTKTSPSAISGFPTTRQRPLTAALTQFEREIAFFNANTDGLIVDEMRNTGGNLCYGENIAARLSTDYFRATGFRLASLLEPDHRLL